jgi:hypothetical protein
MLSTPQKEPSDELTKVFCSNPDHANPATRKPVLFSALLMDNGLQFEGDVKGTSFGNVSNLLYNFQTQLVSPTWFNRGLSTQLTLIPAGFEAGYNLQDQEAAEQKGFGIARYRAGGSFRAFYTASAVSPIHRFEFVIQAVTRQLFSPEAAIDPITQKSTLHQRGNTYYTQGDFKFFFADTAHGRPGFRVSYKRGSLPPVYSFTKGFEFGLIFETADDTQTQQSK